MKSLRLFKFLILMLAVTACAHADEKLHHRERYTLRSGDVLELQYRYTPEQNQTVTVLPDGYVNLNLVGDLRVGDLTLKQAHDLIVEKVRDRLNDPELNLILKEFQKPYVVVAGEVAKPGRFDLRENTTAMQAILLSGGFGQGAQTGQVLLFRKINGDDAEVRVLNLTKLRKTSDLERDIQLQSGDMLFVPRDKVEKISRFIKLANLGLYFNPLQMAP
jgi:polysaccharide export outer membrane protein